MSQRRTRELWCALSDDLQKSFPMECVADQDNINTLKKEIWEEIKKEIKDATARNLKLYSPVVQLDNEEEFKVENGEFLNPRRMITSNPLIPESKDPDVDIVVVVSGGVTPRKRKRSESQSGEVCHSQ